MYALIRNNEIIKELANLPKTYKLKDGKTVSGFHLLDSEIHKQEGWLPVEEVKPKYNNETEYLTNPQYEVQPDKVIKTWQVETSPQVLSEPTVEEYLLELDYRLSMMELGL